MILFADIPLGVDLSFETFKGVPWFCSRMRSLSGAEMLMEAWCSDGDSLVGLTIPRPPSLAGKERSSRSVSFGGALMS